MYRNDSSPYFCRNDVVVIQGVVIESFCFTAVASEINPFHAYNRDPRQPHPHLRAAIMDLASEKTATRGATALRAILASIEAGDAEIRPASAFLLGNCHFDGWGVARSVREALRLWRLAADRLGIACTRLARHESYMGRSDAARAWFDRGARLEDLDAFVDASDNNTAAAAYASAATYRRQDPRWRASLEAIVFDQLCIWRAKSALGIAKWYMSRGHHELSHHWQIRAASCGFVIPALRTPHAEPLSAEFWCDVLRGNHTMIFTLAMGMHAGIVTVADRESAEFLISLIPTAKLIRIANKLILRCRQQRDDGAWVLPLIARRSLHGIDDATAALLMELRFAL